MCFSPHCTNHTLSALTSFTNFLAADQIPPAVVPHLCRVTLLNKSKSKEGRCVTFHFTELDLTPLNHCLALLSLTISRDILLVAALDGLGRDLVV